GDATKIVVLFGDAPTHDCDFYTTSYGGDPGPDGVAGTADDLNFESVVAQLAANDVIVLSVDSSTPGGDAEKSFKYMAYKTGGGYYPLSEAGEIPEAVKELVTSVFGTWVDEITTVISDTVRFRCTIHNNGTGCPLSQIVAKDLLPPSLEYRDNATVNGEPWEPTEVGPKEFVWDLGEWMLRPSERIVIEFDAHVTECGVDTNTQVVDAMGCGESVSDSDTATVVVPCVDNDIYLEPQDSSALHCTTTEVEVWVNAADFQGGQMKLRYDADCADVTDWQRNKDDFRYGTWDSDTPGEEWILFSAEGLLSGNYLIGTLTVHCVSEEACTTAFEFVEPSALKDSLGNEVPANWEDGTFGCTVGTCGDVAPAAGCDGVVDVKDAILLLNYVGYPGSYSLCCETCGDVSPSEGCDGVIDVGDFILLLNYINHPGEYELCCEGEAAATAVSVSPPPAADAVEGAAAAQNEVTFVPQESSAPYGESTEVEIWADAADFQGGQIKFTYDSTCAEVTGWEQNDDDFPYGGWDEDMPPGEEWIVFIAEGPLSGEHLVGTLTVECVSEEDCTTALEFVEPSLLSDDFGNDVPATWVDGTFQRGGYELYLPLVIRNSSG
ncbi:MAG: hypothetical protein ACP5JJ_17425, partial [Anaerolineae bacterium]